MLPMADSRRSTTYEGSFHFLLIKFERIGKRSVIRVDPARRARLFVLLAYFILINFLTSLLSVARKVLVQWVTNVS